ncbi:alpha-L-rhamnosidase C-terminal domain-containing protein [Coraliomargarita algicola]|uniref:alpha-L-rhamnosidase n=1 Tax=Coraliomargarita algicola TaxID=3092156 RepID=A0ABZ0RM28_9BACT|nr:alpha-L-rhamnosidase C-terminal domain-containing protein [Coraliomargarita sp. J2-16]WPJ97275.1 alpha-L-rhamnosidase C-terminal domain-containing protein [Coraliomargarita sp. J2-16]
MKRNLINTVLICMVFSVASALAADAPTGLMTELLEYPEQTVITDTLPEFTWIVNDQDRDEVQTAYQILVATSESNLVAGSADIWDSGKVLSNSSVNVEFGGTALADGSYWWSVRTWDKTDQASPFSDAQNFVVDRSPHAWSEVNGDGEIVVPMGHLVSYPNGFGWTDYRLETTVLIDSGAAGINFRMSDDNNFYMWQLSASKDALRLHIRTNGTYTLLDEIAYDFNAGTEYDVVITATGSVFQTYIDGVLVDTHTNSVHAQGTVGFRTGRTESFTVTTLSVDNSDLTTGTLAPNRYLPSAHEIPAESVVENGENYFVDFGKAAFGTLEFDVEIPLGGTSGVEIRFGEKRNENTVETNPGGSIVYHSLSIDLPEGSQRVHVDLDPYETGLRNFYDQTENTLPFRYAEIIGLPVAPANVKQIAYWVPFNEGDSSFVCSDPVLNEVWEFSRYSMKVLTWLGIYVDGIRETLPYEADAFIQQLGHYSTTREFTTARHSHEYLIKNATWPTEWLSHSVLMAYYDWMYTGNTDSLAEYYDDLKAKSLIALKESNGLISTTTGRVDAKFNASVHYDGPKAIQDIVDWPISERDGYDFRGYNTVVNAFYNRGLNMMRDISEALDMPTEVAFWESEITAHTQVFQSLLFDAGSGIYLDGVGSTHSAAHANFFPLAFDLVSEANMQTVADFVESKGMAPSVYGAQFLLDGLYNAGRGQAALELMRSTGSRSWWNMMQEGSTVTLEAWGQAYKRNLDWNHAWGAAPANIIPRQLMGVTPLKPGFEKIQIKPQIGDLEFASLTMPTVRGPVSVSVEQTSSNAVYTIEIPANATAKILIPSNSVLGGAVNVNGIDQEGVVEGGFIVFDGVGSGTHVFIKALSGTSARNRPKGSAF